MKISVHTGHGVGVTRTWEGDLNEYDVAEALRYIVQRNEGVQVNEDPVRQGGWGVWVGPPADVFFELKEALDEQVDA